MKEYYREATQEELDFYCRVMYPLQDRVFEATALYGDRLYLTGGTALSRFYFEHRLSEDLDFFTTADDLKGLAKLENIQPIVAKLLWDFPHERRTLNPSSVPVLRRRLKSLRLPERRALEKVLALTYNGRRLQVAS